MSTTILDLKTKLWLLLALSVSLGATAAPHCMTVPQGQYRFVSGNVSVDSFAVPSAEFALWTYSGYNLFLFDDLGGHWSPAAPVVQQGFGGYVACPATAVSVCFHDPAQPISLPLQLKPGLQLVSCQSNTVAMFEGIVGRPPDNGTRLYRFNLTGDPFSHWLAPPEWSIYQFTNGVWSPSVPVADIGEAVYVYQPRRILNLRISGAKFTFDLEGASFSNSVTVEWSDAQQGGTWQPLTNFTAGALISTIQDDYAISGTTGRFYRCRLSD